MGNHKTTKQFSQAGVQGQKAESKELWLIITCLSFFHIRASNWPHYGRLFSLTDCVCDKNINVCVVHFYI